LVHGLEERERLDLVAFGLEFRRVAHRRRQDDRQKLERVLILFGERVRFLRQDLELAHRDIAVKQGNEDDRAESVFASEHAARAWVRLDVVTDGRSVVAVYPTRQRALHRHPQADPFAHEPRRRPYDELVALKDQDHRAAPVR